jgi:hypothetical protein
MESYEQAVDLALMVVDLDKTVYATMIRSGLKTYLNSRYLFVKNLNSQAEMNKFMLASKILLNDLQSFVVNNCGDRTCTNYYLNTNNLCRENYQDPTPSIFQTPVFEEAQLDPINVVNSNVTKYLDGFNPDAFNPKFSRLAQPLDTIGLYDVPKKFNPNTNRGYGPESKVRLEHFSSPNSQPNSHPMADGKNTSYNQYFHF